MINKNNCFVCQRIELIKQNKNQYFVRELKSGYVVLADYQYFYGYTIFISKIHIDELYKLGKTQKLFLEEMAKVAEAVIKTFKPKKLNYELLGNTDSHLHWHLIPRYRNDPKPATAIWAIEKEIRCDERYKLSEEDLEKMKKKLIKNL